MKCHYKGNSLVALTLSRTTSLVLTEMIFQVHEKSDISPKYLRLYLVELRKYLQMIFMISRGTDVRKNT